MSSCCSSKDSSSLRISASIFLYSCVVIGGSICQRLRPCQLKKLSTHLNRHLVGNWLFCTLSQKSTNWKGQSRCLGTIKRWESHSHWQQHGIRASPGSGTC